MESEKLKPCPFCNENPPNIMMKMCISDYECKPEFYVECTNCLYVKSENYYDCKSAIEAWNQRA